MYMCVYIRSMYFVDIFINCAKNAAQHKSNEIFSFIFSFFFRLSAGVRGRVAIEICSKSFAAIRAWSPCWVGVWALLARYPVEFWSCGCALVAHEMFYISRAYLNNLVAR